MRTTLTLEPDVSAMIERELAETNASLKAVINDRLRRGYSKSEPQPTVNLPEPLDLGRPLIPNFDNIADVLELLDNDPR